MRLYHGSYCKITEIDLSLSKSNKDFGTGFYLTPDFQRAVTMAKRSTVLNNTGNPEINAFIFHKSACSNELKIKEFKTNTWEWAEFVMSNRDKLSSGHHAYNIVIGPVADSRVDPEIEKYRKEYRDAYLLPENLKILAKRLKYPGPQYIQFCFCTKESLKYLIRD